MKIEKPIRNELKMTIRFNSIRSALGLEDVVKTSIENETDVNLNDPNGWIPLHTGENYLQ